MTPPPNKERYAMNEENVVLLSDGQKVEICHVPPGMRDAIRAKYPMPSVPIIEEKTAAGTIIRMAMEDDPDYLAECASVQGKRDAAWNEAYTLAALKKLRVPDGFDVETEWGEELRYLNPEWRPREGRIGRKLDYIEFGLSSKDMDLVSTKMNEMMGIDLGVVDSIEESFRRNIPEETD